MDFVVPAKNETADARENAVNVGTFRNVPQFRRVGTEQ